MTELEKTENTPQPFTGDIVPTSQLTFDTDALPAEARQYVGEEKKGKKAMFFEVREDGHVLGFGKVLIPEDTSKPPHFRYRYIFPEQRRRGLGQKLRDAVYGWLKEQGYAEVSSGIKNVGKILDNGEIIPLLDSDLDGGWKSYLSMTRADSGQVAHRIDTIMVGTEGEFDLGFTTHLNVDQAEYMPADLTQLTQKLLAALPEGQTLQDILQLAREETVAIAVHGKYIDFLEWVKQLKRN